MTDATRLEKLRGAVGSGRDRRHDQRRDGAAPSLQSNERRVRVRALKAGMYVSALDRPWTDTPFPFQGFHVRDASDVEALARHCRWVIVDVERKLPEPQVSPVGRVVAENPGGDAAKSARGHAISALAPVGGGWLDGLGAMARRLRELAALLGRPGQPGGGAIGDATWRGSLRGTSAGRAGRKSFMRELPRADRTLALAEAALSTLLSRASVEGIVDLDSVRDVSRAVLQSINRDENALQWLMRIRGACGLQYSNSLLRAAYLVLLARQLGLPSEEQEDLGLAGIVLDVGMLRLPREILDKRGRLTVEERRSMRTHVRHSLDMLAASGRRLPAAVVTAVAQHHEREDGSGYPAGLVGDQLSLYGRMVAIVDSFVAMCSVRSHAPAYAMGEALARMHHDRRYYAPMVEGLLQAIGAFPVGSIVLLSSGERAIVVAHSRVRRLRPRVLLLTDRQGNLLPHPVPLNLLDPKRGAVEPELKIERSIAADSLGIDGEQLFLKLKP